MSINTNLFQKFRLNKRLKQIASLFYIENMENAFDLELRVFLKAIRKEEVPSNFTSFYNNYNNKEKAELTNIKINNKILHQSKLINYFKDDGSSKNIANF